MANVALCVNPDSKYVKVLSKGYKFILAEELANKVLGEESFKHESPASTIAGYTTYKYSKGYKGYEFIVDDSGKVSQIHWNNYSYDE